MNDVSPCSDFADRPTTSGAGHRGCRDHAAGREPHPVSPDARAAKRRRRTASRRCPRGRRRSRSSSPPIAPTWPRPFQSNTSRSSLAVQDADHRHRALRTVALEDPAVAEEAHPRRPQDNRDDAVGRPYDRSTPDDITIPGWPRRWKYIAMDSPEAATNASTPPALLPRRRRGDCHLEPPGAESPDSSRGM